MIMTSFRLVGNVPVSKDWLHNSLRLATLPRWRIIPLEMPSFPGAFLFCFLFFVVVVGFLKIFFKIFF